MKDVIEDLKNNQAKRSDFLDQLSILIKERHQRQMDARKSFYKNFIDQNVVEVASKQEKKDYFNTLNERRHQAVLRK